MKRHPAIQRKAPALPGRHIYTKNDLGGPLAFGSVESLRLAIPDLPRKAFTPSLLASALDDRATSAILEEGGYVDADEAVGTFRPSGLFETAFYLP
ncbi:MAG: hypothetical protein U0359_33505 [Byssovorax sp.]